MSEDERQRRGAVSHAGLGERQLGRGASAGAAATFVRVDDLILKGIGTINFFKSEFDNVTVAAVPEPATWMMMMLGMGAVGFSLRRKKDTTLRVRFA